jgi:hypothetical protein
MWWESLLSNKPLIAALAAQASSQGFKIARMWWKTQSFRLKNIAAYGDFPSAHTAFITGVTLTTGLTAGFDSAAFAVGVVFSAIVISDALVLRNAVGNIQKTVESVVGKQLFDVPFRGHTPLEIISGALVGVLWSYVILWFWPF